MKTDVLTLTVTLIFMYKISVAPQARVVPKAFNDNIRRIHALAFHLSSYAWVKRSISYGKTRFCHVLLTKYKVVSLHVICWEK